MICDPITSDPYIIDKEYPPTMMPITFNSDGDLLIGVLLLANGQGPHPTIVLLHGFPGNERNFDLAQIFRRIGWNVMVFHYRGAWGSRGSFSFQNVVADVSAALNYIRREEVCKLYRINPDKIALIGHSMGGCATLLNAPRHPEVIGFVSIAGFNLGLIGKMMQESPNTIEYRKSKFEENIFPLQGTSSQSLVEELLTYGDSLNYINYAEAISKRPVFMIGARYDEAAPIDIHHTPMVHELKKNSAKVLEHTIIDTDHCFSYKRIELARIIISWLEERIKD